MATLTEQMANLRQTIVVNEAWDKKMDTPPSKKGMFKGKTKAELRASLAAKKKKAEKHHKDGTKEPESLKTEIKELEFALRAKNKFGKVNESLFAHKINIVYVKKSNNKKFRQTIKTKDSISDVVARAKEWAKNNNFELKEVYYDSGLIFGKNGSWDADEEENANMAKEHPFESKVNEAWDTPYETPKNKRGMFKGKTKEELRSMLSAAKKKSKKHHEDGTQEPESLKTKIKEIEFALRAKNKFGKVNEGRSQDKDLCSSCGADLDHVGSHPEYPDLCMDCGDVQEARQKERKVSEGKDAFSKSGKSMCKQCKEEPCACCDECGDFPCTCKEEMKESIRGPWAKKK